MAADKWPPQAYVKARFQTRPSFEKFFYDLFSIIGEAASCLQTILGFRLPVGGLLRPTQRVAGPTPMHPAIPSVETVFRHL
jgi:hypothetical protein